MTLAAFQRALCELIQSPDACLDLRDGSDDLLSRYDLSPRERARLLDIVWQRGMSTNCTLYRSNRVTPIYTLLHYTCLVLGDRLKPTLDAYWGASSLRDLEFAHEIQRFAHFVRGRLAARDIVDPILDDVLAFELAANELRFLPRREILRQLEARREQTMGASGPLALHPLIRVVRLRHEPAALLGALAERRVPRELEAADSFLLLSVAAGELAARTIEPAVGHLLWRLQTGEAPPTARELDELVGQSVVVPAQERVPSAGEGGDGRSQMPGTGGQTSPSTPPPPQ